MKTSLSYLTLSLLFVICMYSCDNDPEIPEKPKYYFFSSIMWKLDEGDGMEIIEKNLPGKIFNNHTGTIQKATFTSDDQVSQTSLFYSPQADFLNKWAGEDRIVFAPGSLDGLTEEYRTIAGEIVPLYAGEEMEIEYGSKSTSTVTVSPHTKAIYTSTLFYKKITATYKVCFTNADDSSDKVELEGKWTGMFLERTAERVVIEPIEE